MDSEENSKSRAYVRTGWNINDDLKTIVPRFSAVREIAEHMIREARSVQVRLGAGRVTWFDQGLRLSQYRDSQGPLEARGLYLPDSQFSRSRAALLRRVEWNRSADRERCKRGVVKWPDIRITHYRIAGTTAHKAVDHVANELARALATLLDPGLAELRNLPDEMRAPSPRPTAYLRSVNDRDNYDLQARWVEGWVQHMSTSHGKESGVHSRH